MRLIVNVNFPQTDAGPGPSISLTVDAPDAAQAMDATKEKVLKWMEEQARALHDALPQPPTPTPEA